MSTSIVWAGGMSTG